MIKIDAELDVVRKQLGRAEAALDSLRRDVKPKSEKMYNLMSESYIDMIQGLRAQIDAYIREYEKDCDSGFNQNKNVQPSEQPQ